MTRTHENRRTVTTEAAEIPVAALACSAGGLDALGRILGRLPATFPAAVIVLRHQDARAPNQLAPTVTRSSTT